jgi:hypothetical protein
MRIALKGFIMNASIVTVSVAISAVQTALLCLNIKLSAEEIAMLEDIESVTGGDEIVTVKVTLTEMMLAFKVTTETESALTRLTEFGAKDHFSVMAHEDNHYTVNKERKEENMKEETKPEATKTEEEKPTEAKAEEAKPAAAAKEEVKVEVVESWFTAKTKRNVGIGAAVCAVGVGGWFAWKKFHSTTAE